MDIIDERGRLFGRVNIIDALVVLLGVSVLVAGASLALGGGGTTAGPTTTPTATPTATPTPTPQGQPGVQTATLELGTHPAYVASLVQPGNATLGGADATITDVYRSPHGENVLLAATVRVDGRSTPEGFRVGNSYLRYGVRFTLATSEYQLRSQVATTGGDESLETRTVRTTVETNVSTAVADSLSVGDTQQIAGEPVATVEAVEVLDSGDGWRQLRVDLALVTRSIGDRFEYGGTAVRVGTAVEFETSQYAFRGRVVELDP